MRVRRQHPARAGLLAAVVATLWLAGRRASAQPAAAAWHPSPEQRAQASVRTAGAVEGSNNPPPPERQSFADFASGAPEEPPQYELVLARTYENISWVVDVPRYWKITVYNKGPVDLGLRVPGRELEVVKLENSRGREGATYMAHILLRWDNLAQYTVFSQASPFEHSEHFLDLLRHPQLLRSVQCMSLVYLSTGHPDNVTPQEVVEAHRRHPWYRSERYSLRTLDSIHFNDRGIAYILGQYLQMHGLKKGTNIIHHFFSSIGLPGWVPHEQEVGSFAYGGLFGVHQTMIRRHPRHVYKNLHAIFLSADLHAWLGEKIFLMLFGGPNVADV